ncbi:MAG: polysaccharide export protein [Nitrospira sp.]|nr:polysaccharide export protein [Nitrospira sp.]
MHYIILTIFAAVALASPSWAADDSGALSGIPGLSSIYGGTPAPRPAPAQTITPPAPPLPTTTPENLPAPPAATANRTSQVFGAHLFTGAFARPGPTQFNPDYFIAIGDSIRLRIWGSAVFDSTLVVDAQGNVFLPNVGPVKVQGVRNQDLQSVIEKAIRGVYHSNVFGYASLAEAQPVRVFVSGFVNQPGLYGGTSMDSLLHYLDQAGGIDPDRGSFLNVQVKRGSQLRKEVNLYDFLLDGRIPQVQLADGDVIFVSPRQKTVMVTGLAENTKQFEFAGPDLSVAELMKLAKPAAKTTHVRVIRNTGIILNREYYPLNQVGTLSLLNGDAVEFTADKRPGTITVRVQGEHLSQQEHTLPYGTRLGELTKRIQFNERSDAGNLQLFRLSIKDRQKLILQTSLQSLEAAVLTARSGTYEEAQLRTTEANLILQWVNRAKDVVPTGQVLIAQASQRDELLLENGDMIQVPVKDGLVLVGGEVLFPNTIVFESRLSATDYILRSGGYTQNADMARVIIAHRDGSFEEGREDGFFSKTKDQVRVGDNIMVLPKVDMKYRQIAKEIADVVFKIAVLAGVALRFGDF